jgi:hypothetical protein
MPVKVLTTTLLLLHQLLSCHARHCHSISQGGGQEEIVSSQLKNEEKESQTGRKKKR